MNEITEPILLDSTGRQIVEAIKENTAMLQVKGIKDILDTVGTSHNGIYGGRNFGAITSANIGSFLSEHKVAEGLFTDLYVGDSFTIQDGTYNKEWEIAGFDTYLHKGDTELTKHHLALIPKVNLLEARMNPTDTTTGGYKGSEMFKTTLPAVVANLEKALGARLLTRRAMLSNATNATIKSMAGADWNGATTGWEWTDVKAALMSEVAVYGSKVFSSSFHDVGEDCERLPIFQFKGHSYTRQWFWLRAVASSTAFAYANFSGNAHVAVASDSSGGVRPLIIVG